LNGFTEYSRSIVTNQQEGLIELKDHSSDLRTVGVIQNVYFTISVDQKMTVSYFFDPALNPGQYTISLSISADGGSTYFSPKSIGGALGKKGVPGRNTIEWDIFSDVDELVGDVQVKVEAQAHQNPLKKVFSIARGKKAPKSSFRRRILTPSYKKTESTDGIGAFVGVPWFNFSNDTYRANIENDLISHTFEFLGVGLTYISLPRQLNLSYSMHAFEYEYESSYSWDDYKNVAVYQAVDIEYLHSPLPNIPFVTPFLGLGFSLGEITTGSIDNAGEGLSTSDLYYSGSLLIRPYEYLLFQISLKESIFRKVRKWNRVDMTVGVVL
jgi:hypothetical protein